MVVEARRVGPQRGPQASLLSCPANDIFYGGAVGGGKSFGILLDWLAHWQRYGEHARGILFRRTMPELDDIIEKSRELFPPFGAVFGDQKKTWHFPGGVQFRMRYLERDKDADRYQGHEYTWMGFEEAGNWPRPEPLDKLRARLRSPHGIPVRLVLTGNPGGVGHNWIKARYIDPAPPYAIQHAEGGMSRTFIPAKVEDNRVLLHNDPHYQERIKQSGPDWLVKAWLEGDWNVVAGGMFDDIWTDAIHIVEPFDIPRTWRVDRSFDWGSSHPFSVGWWAESDGTDATLPDGSKRPTRRGDLFRIAEWYGWNGRPNEGSRMLAKDVAKGIREKERTMGLRVQGGPADSSIFDVENGQCIADDMAQVGVRWDRADKSPGSRRTGAEQLRAMLAGAIPKDGPREEPGLFVFSTCRHFIRTVPSLPRSEKDPEDVDTDAEDHIYDEVRYRIRKVNKEVRTTKLKGF